MQRHVSFPLRLEALEDRLAMDSSPLATQLIYELNRARLDPVRYAFERNLVADFSAVPSKSPLAFNPRLNRSAEGHANEMSLENYLRHQSPVDGRWPNQMARDAGYELPSNYPANANFIEAIAGGKTLNDPLRVLDQWLVDAADSNKSNRSLLLGLDDPWENNREVGAGYSFREASDLNHYWSLQAAYAQFGDLFLTGLVYKDLDFDERYDAGEGIEGTEIQAGPWSTQTGKNGEWSLRVAGGRFDVTASGNGLSRPMSTTVQVGTDNMQIDFRTNQSVQINFRSRSDWTNLKIAEDVNNDGFVTPLDALIAINRLNEIGSHTLPPTSEGNSPPPYFDVSGDSNLSPLDALIVINYLNLQAAK